jgi:branched-chain amino acid transport system substrate-binding protein
MLVLCGLALADSRGSAESTDAPAPIVLGLNADMSTLDAESGEAIRRGALVAIEEINSAGGVLGRPLQLRVLDHRRNPARGQVNIERFAASPEVVAVLGGKHTPVVLAELPQVHAAGLPYLIPWAAGTPIIDNGYQPNYVFRVSVRDADAGGFLLEHAGKLGIKQIGLLLEQTGWGRSNSEALEEAAQALDIRIAQTEWFNWGTSDLSPAVKRLRESGAEAIIFVGNTPDGVTLAEAILGVPPEKRLPVISHWGIAGGEFIEPLGDRLDKLQLSVLQTYSFFDPPEPERMAVFLETWRRLFPDVTRLKQIQAPAGVAHSYDLVHLLARAVEQAGSTDRAKVRDALEQIERHEGLVRLYAPPFTPERHDALNASDFSMGQFREGAIVPLARSTGNTPKPDLQ